MAEGGDFLDMLKETKELSEKKARFFYRQFGDALRYMHSVVGDQFNSSSTLLNASFQQGFAHRDIKCENILLNKARTEAKLVSVILY